METKPHWPRSDEPTATSTREEFFVEKLVIDDYELEVTRGPHKGISCALDKKIITIGRDPLCDLVLKNDPTVSYRHCELSIEEEGIRLRDTQSSCGVLMDHIRIFDAYLKPNTTVRIGDTDLVLRQSKGQREIEIRQRDASGHLLGACDSMQALFLRIERLAASSLSVLLLGETGTGKSQTARAIHDQSPRAHQPFVTLNCGAISQSVAESELFGHEKGAFTGASRRRKGVFEQASGGTLFLDEVTELSVALQAKLLDVLERKKLRRVGGERELDVDFRLITATNADVQALIDNQSLRGDLYYRIANDELILPPLRERKGDILLLAQHFIATQQKDDTAEPLLLLPDAIRKLEHHIWPGNVRELSSVMARSVTRALSANAKALKALKADDILMEPIGADVSLEAAETLAQLEVPASPYATEPDNGSENRILRLQLPQSPFCFKAAQELIAHHAVLEALARYDGSVRDAAAHLGHRRGWIYKKLHLNEDA